ncbi:MAG: AAA-associated domain-containing protein [Capsulimonadaceae bacterium]
METANASACLLSGEAVCKYYGEESKRILVLDRIDIAIREGEIVAILGPSGSGKSTLLRILAGLSTASSGSVRFRGEPQSGPNPNVAIVFQTFALFPWLNIYQNVEVGLLNSNVPEMQRRRRILDSIDVIGLDGFEDAYPKELSGGMRQRVGFARALVVQPEVLFMDEPFSALDVLTGENLKKELLSLWRSRKIPTRSIVMVTHNIDEAVMMGDRLVVLGHNPGVVRLDMPGLPVEQRGKGRSEHLRLIDYLYGVMTNPTEKVSPFAAEVPATRPRPYQVLPHVPVGQVTGLVERLHAAGGRADLYVLGHDLHMEVDDLLPIVQAIDLLNLGNIEEGDVFLTPAGVRFALAGVLEEKDIFREQASGNVELIRHITTALDKDPGKRVRYETVFSQLEGAFSNEEAERQLDTAIDWGRYAELFAYDDQEGVFYREKA